MKSFERVIDIIVGIIIILFVPFLYFSQGYDRLLQEMIKEKTSNFTDLIETQGYISRNMYEVYLQELSTANVLLEVSIEHEALVYEPEYRLRSVDEVIEEQDRSYTGENFYTYRPVQTEIPIVNDPVDTSGLNSETNESVLAGAVNQPASSTHIHNDACYYGAEKHVHQGDSSNGGACYTYSSGSTTYCGKTVSLISSTSKTGDFSCYYCGNIKLGVSYTEEFTRCSAGHESRLTARYSFTCSNCGKTSSKSSSLSGTSCTIPTSSNSGYTLSCNKTEGAYYLNGKEVSPVCHLLIGSITATHPIQKIQQGSSMIRTANITFLDGSTRVVLCTTSFTSNDVVQNKTAILGYSYRIWDVNYEVSCNITITVIPKNRACVNGHTYNLRADGSDAGCPYCAAWLRSLAIQYPSNGSLTIYKGKTLQESGVVLLATYMDGRNEYIFSEYVDNLDRNYVGTQTVTIGYKGKIVTLAITTKRNLVQCSICNRNYELYPDESNPGCPYCAAGTPIFTGKVLTYYQIDTVNDILSSLYEGDGRYYVRAGDYISIVVQNKRETLGGQLLGLTIPWITIPRFRIQQGGVIRDSE